MRVALMVVWATGFAVFMVVLVATVIQFRKDQKDLLDFRFMSQPPPPRAGPTVMVDGRYVRFWDPRPRCWRWCDEDDRVEIPNGRRIWWHPGQTPQEYAEKLRRDLI